MRGYPQFSFWISIALVKIYISGIIINRGKDTFELVGTVLNARNFMPTMCGCKQFLRWWSSLLCYAKWALTNKDLKGTWTLTCIYGLTIDPHNDQRPVGPVAQLVEHWTGIAEVWVGVSSRDLFLESPETFRVHLGWHNSLSIFKTKASRGMTLRSYFHFYYLYNTWKDQLYRISRLEFYELLFGPEKFSELSRNGPQVLESYSLNTMVVINIKLFSFSVES